MKANKKIIAALGVAACVVCACVVVGLCVWQSWAGDGAGGTGSTDGEEEWEGQSQGYVGSDGEGALSWNTFDGTEDEYLDAVANEMSSGHVELSDYEIVYPEDGSTPYRKQLVVIFFYRSYGEERAREIVADMGGEWMEDYFGINPDEETAHVIARFSKDSDVVALGKQLEAMPEVESAGPSQVIIGVAD